MGSENYLDTNMSVCKILMRALTINNTPVFVLVSITGN